MVCSRTYFVAEIRQNQLYSGIKPAVFEELVVVNQLIVTIVATKLKFECLQARQLFYILDEVRFRISWLLDRRTNRKRRTIC